MAIFKKFHKKDLIIFAAAVCSVVLTVCAVKVSTGNKGEVPTELVQTECQPISKNTNDTAVKIQTIDTPPKEEATKEIYEISNVKSDTDKAIKDTETDKSKTVSTKDSDTDSDKTSSKSDTETDKSKTVSTKDSGTDSDKTSSKSDTETDKSKTVSTKDSDTDSDKTSSKSDTETDKSKTVSTKGSDTDSDKTSAKSDTETDKSKTVSTKDSDTDTISDKDKTESKTATKNPPKEYHITMKHITQFNDMPTGCEIVSTKMVLDYYGKNVTYKDMLSHMTTGNLKVSKDGKLYGRTPYQAFLGDPTKNSGFGCYPPVILEMMNNYDFDDLYAEDTCKLPLDFVAKTYLTQDIPVLVWATIGMGQSYLTSSWYVADEKDNPTKEKYTWRAAEHCLVLVGYDEKYYYFCDPLSYQDVTMYEKKIVEKRYKEVGYNSMIIREYE